MITRSYRQLAVGLRTRAFLRHGVACARFFSCECPPAEETIPRNQDNRIPEYHRKRMQTREWQEWKKNLKMPVQSPHPPVRICREAMQKEVLQKVWEWGTKDPHRPAIIMGNDETQFVTFHELHLQVHSVNAFLQDTGFKKGDVAAVVAPNSCQFAIFQLGAFASGGAVSGANALFTDYELEAHFTDSQCSLVLTDDENLEKVQHAARNCSTIKMIICIHDEKNDDLPAGVIPWSELIKRQPNYNHVQVDGEDMCLLPYSSGTTGSPKGVMIPHRSYGTMVEMHAILFRDEIYSAIGYPNADLSKECHIVVAPMYYLVGAVTTMLGLKNGFTTITFNKFHPETFCAAVEKYKPKTLFLFPTLLGFLAKADIVSKFDMTSVRYFLCGGSPMDENVFAEFFKRHPYVQFASQGYGMTECGMGSNGPYIDRVNSFLTCGYPTQGFEQKIVDIESKKDLGFNETGEVCIRGPTFMLGYLNKPEATAQIIDKDGWMHTGDIGYNDDEGHLIVKGRLKELIKVKGMQVSPNELEDILLGHPLIIESCVIGVKGDERRGEFVRAYVVRSSESLIEDDVRDYLKEKTAEYKHITGGVVFVDSIPKSPSGKVLRRILQQDADNVIAK